MRQILRLVGRLERIETHSAIGFALDRDDPERPLSVEIASQGMPVAVGMANLLREDLGDIDPDWLWHGFRIQLPPGNITPLLPLVARLAATGQVLEGTLSYVDCPSEPSYHGLVEQVRALTIEGFAVDSLNPQAVLSVVAIYDGCVIARARADISRPDLAAQGIGGGLGGFSLTLPLRLADAHPHSIVIALEGGIPLRGSPVVVFHSSRGLAGILLDLGRSLEEDVSPERLSVLNAAADCVARLEHLEKHMIAFNDWPQYRRMFLDPRRDVLPTPGCALVQRALLLVFAGPRLAETLDAVAALNPAGAGLVVVGEQANAAGVPYSELPQLLRALAAHGAAQVVCISAGVLPHPTALAHICHQVNNGIAYSDYELVIAPEDGPFPALVPDWDYDLYLAMPYVGGMWAADGRLFRYASAVTSPSDLFLTALERCPPGAVRHVPLPLFLTPHEPVADTTHLAAVKAHVRRVLPGSTIKPDATGRCCRVDWPDPGLPLTLLVATKDKPRLIEGCMESLLPLLARAGMRVRIIDNGSKRADTLELLARYAAHPQVSLLSMPGPFNYSALINAAAANISEGLIGILNDDLVFASPRHGNCIAHACGFFSRPDVGVVGMRLLYPDGNIQHGGIVAGMDGLTEHAFRGLSSDAPGYLGIASATRSCAAVTGACLFTRADLFHSLGGFDATSFPVNFNDVDYCFRVAAAGFACLVTPHGTVVHLESASLGASHAPENHARFQQEAVRFQARWPEVLEASPHYHPLLNRCGQPYRGLTLAVAP